MRIISAENIEELSHALNDAHNHHVTIDRIDLSRMRRIVSYIPEDMTVRVEAGIPLATLQRELARSGQQLPVDPPDPERLDVGGLLATAESGPRRYGWGTIREYLIGMTVVLADGAVVRSGGNVVKNVAGYDLPRLFVGSRGTLGVIAEASFRLLPIPEQEEIMSARLTSLDEASGIIEALLDSPLQPLVLDLHNQATNQRATDYTVVVGLAGFREDVEEGLAVLQSIGRFEPGTLDYEARFRNGPGVVHRWSVLPSRLVETLRTIGDRPFVARAGNGVIYCRGAAPPATNDRPVALIRRVKDLYDPRHILPEPEM